MIAKLKNSNARLLANKVKTCGPNADYPLPWIISKFPGTSICSIISVGGRINETIISMITTADAEKVMKEITKQ